MHACTLLGAAYAHKPISFVAFRTFVSCNCAFRTLSWQFRLQNSIFSSFQDFVSYQIQQLQYCKPNSPVSNFVLTDTFNKFYAVRFGLVIWRFLYLEITRCQETRDADWVTDLTVHFAAHALLDTGNIPLFMKPERHEVTGQNHTVQWQHIGVTSQWGWSR